MTVVDVGNTAGETQRGGDRAQMRAQSERVTSESLPPSKAVRNPVLPAFGRSWPRRWRSTFRVLPSKPVLLAFAPPFQPVRGFNLSEARLSHRPVWGLPTSRRVFTGQRARSAQPEFSRPHQEAFHTGHGLTNFLCLILMIFLSFAHPVHSTVHPVEPGIHRIKSAVVLF